MKTQTPTSPTPVPALGRSLAALRGIMAAALMIAAAAAPAAPWRDMHGLWRDDANRPLPGGGAPAAPKDVSVFHAPVLDPTLNSQANDTDPFILPDGLSMYFSSDRPGGQGGFDIWFTTRSERGAAWNEPVNLGPAINTALNEIGPMLHNGNRELFFVRSAGTWQDNDIYHAYRPQVTEPFGTAEPANGVNLAGPESYPYLLGDQYTLIFSSDRPGGAGDDIWVAQRDSSQGPPQEQPFINVYRLSASNGFNGPDNELSLHIDPNGWIAYLVTAPAGGNDAEIYEIDAPTLTGVMPLPVLIPALSSPAFEGGPSMTRDHIEMYLHALDRPGGQGGYDLWRSVTRDKLLGRVYVSAASGNDATGDGTAQAPFATIQRGLDEAIDGFTSKVVIQAGTYTGPGNRDLNPKGKRIVIEGESGPAATIIDCQGLGRGFHLNSGERSETVITGLTITNGRAPVDQYGGAVGGGIYLASGSPTITNCVISFCVAQGSNLDGDIGGVWSGYASGGGIGGSGALVSSCVFRGNQAIGGNRSASPAVDGDLRGGEARGGAIRVSGGTIEDCVFEANSCRGGDAALTGDSTVVRTQGGEAGGGAVANGSTLVLRRSRAEGNSARGGDATGGLSAVGGRAAGGAVFLQRNWDYQSKLEDCTLSGNSATGGTGHGGTSTGFVTGGRAEGGGAFSDFGVTGCVFSRNTSTGGDARDGKTNEAGRGDGGGIDFGSRVSLSGCVVEGNRATAGGSSSIRSGAVNYPGGSYGGGASGVGSAVNCSFINNEGGSSTDSGGGEGGGMEGGGGAVTNCTFSGNRSLAGASALAGGGFTVTHCAFINNSSPANGAVGDGTPRTVKLQNTIMAYNTPRNANGITSLGNNLWTDNSVVAPLASDLPNTDPMLLPLRTTAEGMMIHELAAGSPAIDAGVVVASITTDQLGRPRNLDGNGDGTSLPDMGAVEFDPADPPPTPTATPTPTPPPSSTLAQLYVAPGGNDSTNDGSESQPFATIQKAIDWAGPATLAVILEPGRYTGPGNRDINFFGKPLTVRARSVTGPTMVDCEGQGRGFIFNGGETRASVLQGIWIANGAAPADDPRGGGVLVLDASPSILNCTFTSNTARGGGVEPRALGGALCSVGGSPLLRDCTFDNNTASGEPFTVGNPPRHARGGAAYLEGSGEIASCVFYNNKALGGDARPTGGLFQQGGEGEGGALYLSGPSSVADCRFMDNLALGGSGYMNSQTLPAAQGAAGRGGAVNATGSARFNHCTFTTNRAEGGNLVVDGAPVEELESWGGALHATNGVQVLEAVFDRNIAGRDPVQPRGQGGAVYLWSDLQGGYLKLDRCAFLDNIATGAGGGAAVGGQIAVFASTFSGNSAPRGGAVYTRQDLPSGPLPRLNGCTLANNSASDSGGAIHVDPAGSSGQVQFENTLFAVNGDQPFVGACVSRGHNLSDAIAPELNGLGDLSGVDPGIGLLWTQPTGDFTPTYALLDGSPAIDAGYIPQRDALLITDQRGHLRLADGDGDGLPESDIGAYEYGIDAGAPGHCQPGPTQFAMLGMRVTYQPGVIDEGTSGTQFTYRVQNLDPALSASGFTLAIPGCQLASAFPAGYTSAVNPETGELEVSWPDSIAPGQITDFRVAVTGPVALGSVRASSRLVAHREFAVAGIRQVSGQIAGPRGDCFAGGGEIAPGARIDGRVDFQAGGDDGGSWTGGALALGAGAKDGEQPLVSVNAMGLCMSVPAAGDNIALWISPESFLPLLDNVAYRVRATMSTSQTMPDAIPFWNLIYDNYHASGAGNTFGGEAWFLDVAGGANGVGRPQARSTFEVWIAPNAALTPQWRDAISGGAFTPESDAANDIRLAFRVLDLASASINAGFDEGEICLNNLRVDAFSMNDLETLATVYDGAIQSSTHAVLPLGGHPQSGSIDDAGGKAVFKLDAANDRVALIPALGPPPHTNESLYPITWTADTLYRVAADLQLAADSSGEDPVDAIFLGGDTVTNELGQTHFSTRGSLGNMFHSASPRRAADAGGPQRYIAFMHGQGGTLSLDPGANRLRPILDLFNTSSLFGEGSGRDAVEAVRLTVETVRLRP